jgi:alanine racemase
MQSSTMIRRTRVEVDLAAIVENAHTVRAITGAGVVAVVKADGYGHGAVAVARALAAARAVAGFGVSLVEEGVTLRDAGVTAPVLVMGPSQHGGEDDMVMAGLTPVIGCREDVAALAAVARRRSRAIEAHLKVDTGMGRLGVARDEAAEIAADAGRAGITVVGLMTHFACADTDDPGDPASMTREQLQRFRDVDRAVTAAGAPLRVRHAANSSGALLFPEARLDLVRTGIAIYGNGRWPVDDPAPRRSAMRLVTEVAQLRTVAEGTSVGYGATWRAERASRVAVLPIGYAFAAIRGRRVPLIGVISMDIAVADVTDVPEVAVGDAAVLLGRASGGASISVAEYGAWAGLSEYEVTCGMSKRVPRTYVGDPP